MAQLIDKDRILAEIERRIKEVSQIEKASYEIGLFDAYKIVLSFINTLEVEEVQEEPVDKCKGCNNVKGCITCVDGDQWAHYEEPVREDLGEYINELSKQFPEVSFAKLSRIAVRVAKWQKQQGQSTIELAEDHAMLAGMNRMEEQIMNKAKSGIGDKDDYIKFEDDTWLDLDPTMRKPAFDVKEGEKVKVLIIKEV